MTIPPAIRRACLAAALLAAMPFGAQANEPKAAVKGPATCRVGQTVFLSAKDSATDGDRPLEWRVLGDEPGQSIIFDQGGFQGAIYAFTASTPGTLDLALIAQGNVDGRIKVAIQTYRLVVSPDVVPDPPAPKPVPAPDPPPAPAPPAPAPIVFPPGSDQALGQAFTASMTAGVAGIFEQAAVGTWTSSADLSQFLHDEFAKVFTTSWIPIADSIEGVAGPASIAPLPVAAKTAIMLKLKQASEGAKGAAK